MENRLNELIKAKENVVWLANNPDGSVDFHDLVYWANEVVRMREELRKI